MADGDDSQSRDRTRGSDDATDGDRGGTMTLAFELSAIESLARPRAVVKDAREWSRHVGVIANDDDAVETFLDDHDLDPDFRPDGRDNYLALSEVRAATATDRHVFVGDGPEDRRVAENLGWEYLPVRTAAEKADWTVADGAGSGGGLFARLRDPLAAAWPFGR